MTELSNWGKWGPDDQAGTINLITAAKRKSAAALVKDGIPVSLSLDADLPKEGPTGGPLPGMLRAGVRAGGTGQRVRPPGGNPPAGRGQGGGFADRTTWTLTSRPPGPEPRPLAAYVVDTIAVSYHGNNTTHLDALATSTFKARSITASRKAVTRTAARAKTM